jgi:DGQHR domain-containing protein
MPKKGKKPAESTIRVPAIRTVQGGVPLFAFFAPGGLVSEIADISRISRDEKDELAGFQRGEIRNHVNAIGEYLRKGDVLFPNAIILAFSREPRFDRTRGVPKDGATLSGAPGYIELPRRAEGSRIAWIVDGQQRSLAMKQCDSSFPVPVVGFVSDETMVHREQFILVNKARPLPQRLIQELLPVTNSVLLPRELEAKRVPSQLCDKLNRDPKSPFFGLIRRPSMPKVATAIVMDTVVTNMIQKSVEDPRGALSLLKDLENDMARPEEMYELLHGYWSAVKDVFPKAWGLKPERSRLMHSAGIAAMGALMDRIAPLMPKKAVPRTFFAKELRKISQQCAWTSGEWPLISRRWDEMQATPSDIKLLEGVVVQLYTQGLG